MIKRFKDLKDKYDYDPERAEAVKNFIEKKCRHVEGEWAGQPFKLLPFQWEDIIMPVFGLINKKTGTRLINECYIEIPKKNGKTTLMAAIELYLLFGDGEPGAKIFNCAGDDDQADLLFDTAKRMVFADQSLERNSRQLITKIHHKDRYIQKITSKAGTKHGKNAHAVIMDELHVQENAELYETMKYAGSTRRNPLFVQITTAGFDKTSICYERHEYTRQILSGIKEDDNFWGVIYAAQESDDPYKEETWSRVNPIYDYSDTFRRHFKKDATEAKNNVSMENAYKRLRLNIWTSTDEKWISDQDWANGNGKLIDLKGKTCYAGLDLASTADTTALVLVFPVEDIYYILPFIFVPEETISKRERKNDLFYNKWTREGHLIRTPGNITDYGYVRKKLNDLKSLYDIRTIGFDPYNALQFITTMSQEDGFEVVEYRQGWQTMSEPTKEFERLLLDGKIKHGGHPVLRWMADNARVIKNSNDNYRVAKGKYSTDKVDGIIASIIAIGECIKHRVEETPIMEVW